MSDAQRQTTFTYIFFTNLFFQMNEHTFTLSEELFCQLQSSSNAKATADAVRNAIQCKTGVKCFLRVRYRHFRKKASRKKNCDFLT